MISVLDALAFLAICIIYTSFNAKTQSRKDGVFMGTNAERLELPTLLSLDGASGGIKKPPFGSFFVGAERLELPTSSV